VTAERRGQADRDVSPLSNGSPADDLPHVGHESLLRPRLLLAVQGRWNRPVTAVVGGAGFGKTTLLAQAVRENRLDRSGVDVTLRLEPGDTSALRLAARLLTELGAEAPRSAEPDDLLAMLVDVVWGAAPTPLCLVLDDVHEVASGSAGLALLTRLVHALPGNTHLLVGARTLPEIGVARLAAGGEALVLREEDLRFTEAEVAEFARLRGVPPEQLAAARGWPALAELLARATGVTTGEYVWEQVIGPLDLGRRARLVELAALGGADDDLATTIAGEPVVLGRVLADVPLVSRSDAGWWELHDVVADPIMAREPVDVVADVRRRGGIHAQARGDADRALRLFVAAAAWDDVLATLRGHFVQLGAPDPSVAATWAALLPAHLDADPEVLLVQSVAKTVVSAERGYELGEQAVAAFAARGDADGELAALARLGAIAWALMDTGRLVPHVERISELAATGHPWAVALDAVVRGAYALMIGDWRKAEAILAPVAAEPSQDASEGLAGYLCARAQVEGGRFDAAARTVDRMPDSHRERVRDGVLGVEVAIAQALGSGDVVLDELRAVAEARLDRRPLIARRVARCRLATALAVLGDLSGAREQMVELERIGPPNDATIDEELLAAAAVAVLEDSEDEAARLLARVPDHGMFFPPLESIALLYVLRPDLRERYDARDLEGVHAQRREFARALVAARAGDLEPLRSFRWPRETVVRWFAPAPWLLEAAVYSAAAGGSPPVELLQRVGPTQRHVLRRLDASSVRDIARTSATFAAVLPPAAPDPLALRVLGALEVDVDGVASGAPELRRERVRSLLGLLVVRRSVRRTEAAGLLWPKLGNDQALGNLRVTLTHLLKLIEPRREKHAPSYFIRQEHERLTLRDDPVLRVDSWEFEAAAAEAEALDRSGAPSLALEAHVRAVELWRGELLADVESADWLEFDRIRLGTLYVRSALRAGELLAARHELGHAAVMARRAVTADPWAEAAYRLLATIELERGDRSSARRVLDHLDQVLAQLGVEPGPETVSLRRRCLESG
jgi:DNA-binding SARP family transcriptional activator